MEDEEKIHATFIIELLGKPIEHLKEAMETHVVKLGSEKGVKILNKQYHEPILASDSKTMYTTFAEVELLFDSVENYLGIIFAYLPSHVEIIKPERLIVTNYDLSEIGSKVLQRIHGYDAIVKNVLQERENLIALIKEEAPALFKKLTTPPKDSKENVKQSKKQKKKSSSKKTKKK